MRDSGAETTQSLAWYEEWFAREEYELIYSRRDRQESRAMVDFVERVAEPNEAARILDLACGRGRHAMELAERGYDVTGVDLSDSILSEARRRTRRQGLRVRYVRADMRKGLGRHSYDGVVNFFTSFGYFETDAEHSRSIAAVSDALVPGGFFVQDFLNAAYVIDHLVESDERKIADAFIVQRRWIEAGRVNKEIFLQRRGNARTFTESVRLFNARDFERFYAAAGLHLVATFGDYDGSPLSEESPRLILYSVKKANAGG